jgi:type II secretory pathway component PulC
MKNFIFLFYFNFTFAQVFITIDKDTNEFIEDTNYSLFNEGNVVYKATTIPNALTQIDPAIVFDSIVLSKADYETLGLLRKNVDSVVYLTKKVIHLDEVVINSSKDKEIMLGETNRFVKRRARPLLPELDFGTVFAIARLMTYL